MQKSLDFGIESTGARFDKKIWERKKFQAASEKYESFSLNHQSAQRKNMQQDTIHSDLAETEKIRYW